MQLYSKDVHFSIFIYFVQENVCGYFEGEFTKNKWDWKEGWDIESRDGTLENQGTGPRDRGMNQYPEDLLEFNAVIKEFHAEAFKVAFELLKAIWTSLGGDLAYIFEEFGPTAHTSRLRLNYYPKCPTPSQCFGVGEHADPGAVTLLLQDDDVSSLQVKRDGVWYNVHPVKGKKITIVNIVYNSNAKSDEIYILLNPFRFACHQHR